MTNGTDLHRDSSPAAQGMFRTALFPATGLLRALEALRHDDQPWESFLRESFASSQLRDAIAVSSRSFASALEQHESIETLPERVKDTFVKYALRAHWRATPFGLFSGVGLLWSAPAVAENNELPLIECSAVRMRLDRGVLARTLTSLQAEAQAERSLIVRTNRNIARFSNVLRFLRFGQQQAEPHYTVEEVELLPELADVLDLASGGANISECEAMLAMRGVDKVSARSFVDELIEAGLLLALPYRSETAYYETSVLDFLEAKSGASADSLRSAVQLTSRTYPIGEVVPAQSKLLELLSNVDGGSEHRSPVQADTYVETKGQVVVSPAELSVLRGAVKTLFDISPPIDKLAGCRARLLRRFGTGVVPILRAFDPVVGVDIEAGLNDFDPSEGRKRQSAILADLLLQVSQDGDATSLELTADTVQQIAGAESVNLPLTFFALVERVRTVAAARHGLLLRYAGGTPAGRLLTRFADLHPELESLCARIKELEKKSFAPYEAVEVLYSQSARVGNVTRRPLTNGDLSLAISGGERPSENTLSLADVGLAVSTDERFIRLVRLDNGQPLTPQATTALNFENKSVSPIYRFLCRLQFQSRQEHVQWDWGSAGNRPFLPRVTFNGVVLSRAMWRLSARLIEKLRTGCAASNLHELERLRIPPLLVYSDADRELPLSLASPEMVRAILPHEGAVTLCEVLDPVSDLRAGVSADAHRCELVIVDLLDPQQTARGESERRTGVQRALLSEQTSVHRHQHPGGRWISLRLYCNRSAAEKILARTIAPHCEAKVAAGVFELWFFLHYRDEEEHLRVRAFVSERSASTEHLQDLLTLVSSEAGVWKVEVDTYLRELERFGGHESLALLERVFHLDSLHAYRAIDRELAGEGAADRHAVWCGHAFALATLLGCTTTHLTELLADRFGRTSRDWALSSKFIREHERSARSAVASSADRSIHKDEVRLGETLGRYRLGVDADILLSVLHLSYVRHWGVGDRSHERGVHLLLLRVVRGLMRSRAEVNLPRFGGASISV